MPAYAGGSTHAICLSSSERNRYGGRPILLILPKCKIGVKNGYALRFPPTMGSRIPGTEPLQ